MVNGAWLARGDYIMVSLPVGLYSEFQRDEWSKSEEQDARSKAIQRKSSNDCWILVQGWGFQLARDDSDEPTDLSYSWVVKTLKSTVIRGELLPADPRKWHSSHLSPDFILFGVWSHLLYFDQAIFEKKIGDLTPFPCFLACAFNSGAGCRVGGPAALKAVL